MKVLRQVLEQVVERPVELSGIGRLLILVEHDVHRAADLVRALGDEHGDHIRQAERYFCGGLHALEQQLSELLAPLAHGVGEGDDEDHGVVIQHVQLVPGRVCAVALQHLGGGGGLAVAGRRADHHQAACRGGAEAARVSGRSGTWPT